MLCGGYFRGSSVLVTGAPGTAKSTLAGALVQAVCAQGERVLYVGYDEGVSEIVRNLRSVNVDLAPYLESGLLQMRWVRSDSRSPEEHLILLKRFVQEQEPRCIVIDPLSALTKSGTGESVLSVVQRLLYWTKAHGVTLFCTSLLENLDPEVESSQLRISTVADTWIHLTNVAQGGERNRALTIVKSRGTGHSNQVRELVLSNEGITLANVYSAGGAVIMGTARWEREQSEEAERQRSVAEIERKRRELAAQQAELQARVAALQVEIETRGSEMQALLAEQQRLHQQQASAQTEIMRRRGADAAGTNGGLESAGGRPESPSADQMTGEG
jgi:circadian clock protein KaiC